MELIPTHLLSETDSLIIHWSDSSEQRIKIKRLRDQCPCADCRKKREDRDGLPKPGLPIITVDETKPVQIVKMEPVGNYAYLIRFSDGHASGIFTFDYLNSLE
jgi:DUF971 family protein